MNRIKQLCEEKDISLTELGRQLDIDRTSISRFAKDDRSMKVEKVFAIADYFGVSPDYLMNRSNIRNEKEFHSMIKDILIEHGYEDKPLEEVREVLESTLQLYKIAKKNAKG